MEQEKILSTINDRLESEGIKTAGFQRSFGDYISNNLPAEGTEPDDAYFDKHVKILKSFSGQFNHDVAAGVEEFKKNYKPEPPESNPNPKSEPKPDPELEKFKKDFEELKKKYNEKDSSEKQAEILRNVKAELKKKGATDDYVLKKTLQGVTFDTEKKLEDTVTEMLTRYNKEYTDCRGKGAAPRGGGKGAEGKGKTKADDFWERKARKEGFRKKN